VTVLDASAWAAVVVAGGTVLLVVIGVAGYMFGSRVRAEEKAEKLGRIEGRIDGRQTDRSPHVTDENVFMIIGGLRTDVSHISEDIRDIRRDQEANGSAARLAHENFSKALSTVSSEVAQVKVQLAATNRSVQALLRARRAQGDD
jgi:hypothetical protein